jgi:hypothetical protein
MADPPRIPPPEWLDIPDPAGSRFDRTPPPPSFASTFSPTRAEVARRRVVALLLSVGWALGWVAALGWRPGIGGQAAPVLAQGALWTGLGLLGLYAAIGRGSRRLGTPPWATWLTVVALPAAYVGLAFLWVPGATRPTYDWGPLGKLAACALIGLSVAAPMLGMAAWAVRRCFVNAARWRGAAIGVAGGFAATTVLVFHCGISSSGHIAVGHGLPLVLAALAGAWLGARSGQA